jgi:hypothetical protein
VAFRGNGGLLPESVLGGPDCQSPASRDAAVAPASFAGWAEFVEGPWLTAQDAVPGLADCAPAADPPITRSAKGKLNHLVCAMILFRTPIPE